MMATDYRTTRSRTDASPNRQLTAHHDANRQLAHHDARTLTLTRARTLPQAREASLAFAWSRMRVIDESAGKQSKTKLDNLSFEDFCEALVHVALMKVRLNWV